MKASIVLPFEYINTIYLFICFLVFFWLFKAVKRFYRSLVLRYAATHDSIVQIQGLGSYLSYFDGATSAHLHSIVHTRQTKPPVDMNMMMVPCSLLKANLISDSHEKSILEIQFNSMVPGKLLLLSNFNMRKFRSAVAASQQRKRNANHFFSEGNNYHNVSFRDSLFSLDQQSISTLSDTRKCQLSFLSEQEVCDRTCAKYDCTTGVQTVRFAFTNPRPSSVASPSEPTEGKEEGKTNGRSDSTSSSSLRRSHSRNRSEVFTLAIAFLPNTTDHVPAVRPYQRELIRDRDSMDRDTAKTSSGPSPSKSTVIFDNTDSGKDSISSAQNTAGFLNFRSYFSLGGNDSHRSTATTKRLIVPLESPVSSSSDATTGDVKRDYYRSTDPATAAFFSASTAGRKREVCAVSLFTFQFPANLLFLFREDGNGNNNNTSTNPVLERSNGTSASVSSSSTTRRRSHASKQHHFSASSPSATTTTTPTTTAAATFPPRSKEVLPKDLTIMDKTGRLFNSLEIFGLASLNEGGSNVSVGPPLSTGNSANNSPEPRVAPPPPDKVSAITAPTLTTEGIALGSSSKTRISSEAHAVVANSRSSDTNENFIGSGSYHQSVGNRSSSSAPLSVRLGKAPSTEVDLEAGREEKRSEEAETAATEQTTNNTPNPTEGESIPITPSTSAIFQGGKFVREDCVICLTDPKNVVLLPCRSCLVYVDKCPVCRAFFEEYVVIQIDNPENNQTNNSNSANNNNTTTNHSSNSNSNTAN